MIKTSKIWKPKNQLFCDLKAITSLRLKVQMKCFLLPNLKEQQKSGRSPFNIS